VDKTRGSNSGCGVYALVNRANGKMYVGSSKNFYNRIKMHKSSLGSNNHYSRELQEDYNAGHKIDFVILEWCEPANLIHIERKFIDFFADFTYNFRPREITEDDLKRYWNDLPKTTKKKPVKKKRKSIFSPPARTYKGPEPVSQICKETGKVIANYQSMNLAAEAVGTTRQNIYHAIKNKSTAVGFRWVKQNDVFALNGNDTSAKKLTGFLSSIFKNS
jgi:hypothetical protein